MGGYPFDSLRPARAHGESVAAPAYPELTVGRCHIGQRRKWEDIVKTQEAEKIAQNESLFREVNERIAETAERFDAVETRFVCECADPTCTDRVDASLEEYEQVREDGATFLLVPGHEDDRVESVITLRADHAVVEKRHPVAASLAQQLNPRAAA